MKCSFSLLILVIVTWFVGFACGVFSYRDSHLEKLAEKCTCQTCQIIIDDAKLDLGVCQRVGQ